MAEPTSGPPSIVGTTKTATSEKKDSIETPSKVENSALSFAALFPKDGKQENAMATTTTKKKEGLGDASQRIEGAEATPSASTTQTETSAEAAPTSEAKADGGSDSQDEKRPLDVSSQSSDAESSEIAKGDDADFDPSSELQDFDDEAVSG